MRASSSSKYPQDLPYCLSSEQSDPSCDFAVKEGWLTPTKLFEYAYSATSNSDPDDPEAVNDHAASRKRTLTYASRSYIRLFRLIFSFTVGCLTAIVIYQLIWPAPSYGQTDPFDEVFPLSHPRPDEHDEAPEARFENFMHNVLPIRCHSHNDYWRRTPLYAAIGSGCISVEADVWFFDDNLYVGHDTHALTRESTLSSMYLEPIEKMLRSVNEKPAIGSVESSTEARGIFSADPSQTLILLIDFKTEASTTYDKVYAELSSLRDAGWLTHWNGTDRVERPLTIVASGNVPFDRITENQSYRDIFCDAPLDKLSDPTDELPSAPSSTARPDKPHTITDLPAAFDRSTLHYKYNPSNSYYASMDLKGVVGLLSQYSITPKHIETLKQQIHDARQRGLVPRYWGAPRWPRNFRDYTWEILMESDVGVLNVDDLRAARKGHWGRWSHQDPNEGHRS